MLTLKARRTTKSQFVTTEGLPNVTITINWLRVTTLTGQNDAKTVETFHPGQILSHFNDGHIWKRGSSYRDLRLTQAAGFGLILFDRRVLCTR